MDSSALENLSSMPAFDVPPAVVPIPETTVSTSADTKRESEEEEKEESALQGEPQVSNPPAVVPVPADALPSENVTPENL